MISTVSESGQPRTGVLPVRLHQLDGLRALAILVVLVHHLGANNYGALLIASGSPFLGNLVDSGSAAGVELFFVLSGIVLLRPYLRQARSLDLKIYLLRRAQRLWPPFLAAWVLAGGVILLTSRYPSWWTRGAGLPEFSFRSWLAQIGIVYWGNQLFNWAWWSLTIEIIFYLLVPLLVPIVQRLRPSRAQMIVVWVAAVLVAIASYQLWPVHSFGVYTSCFAAGVLLAMHDLPSDLGWKMCLGGAAYVLIACRWPWLNVHVGWGLFYFGLVSEALDSTGTVANWFSSWPMVWLGERSYSLFLIHFSIFTAVCHAASMLIPRKGLPYYLTTRAIELPLALLASMVIFVLIERRFAHNLVSADAFWPTLKRPERRLT